MIGLILAMFNGEQFIIEQLNSILNQTIVPDEVLIVDDCSTDCSYQRVLEFIKKNNLSRRLKKNDINKGRKKTFNDSLSEMKSDYIFFCDQDDIWFDNKIEDTLKAAKKTNALVICSNYTLYYTSDNASKVLDKEVKKIKNDDSITCVNVVKDFYIRRPGCSMCVTRDAVNIACAFTDLEYPHDAIFWKLAFLENRLFILNKSLFKWRRHDNNASTVKKQSLTSRKNEIENELLFAKRLASSYMENNIAKKFFKMSELRKKFFDTKNIFYWFMLYRYKRLYVSFKSYLGDFVICYLR